MKKRIVGLLAGIALIGGVGSANANLLQNGDFDVVDNSYIGTRWGTPLDKIGTSGYEPWDVYNSLPGGWMKGNNTAGIEIQTSGTLSGVNAQSGNNYVELDSNWPDDDQGGTNSSMYQTVMLGVGSYELSFYYRPRTSDAGDNGIIAYLNSNIPANLIGQVSLANPPVTDWIKEIYTFSIATAGSYDLYFAAGGTDNKLGGFIDSVALNPVPEPATMLLFGAGLAGLAGSRLRRKK